jgi:tetratricopeptide (TPR) repeat protein
MTYIEQIREADSAFGVDHYLRAVEAYKKAYQLKKSIYPLQRLALCYQENKRYEQAQSYYQMALGLDANDPLIRFRYAVFLCRIHEFKHAERFFFDLLEEHPDGFAYFKELGHLYELYQQKWDDKDGKVLTMLEKALSHRAANIDFYKRMLRLYHRANEKQRADKLIAELLEKNQCDQELLNIYLYYFVDDSSVKIAYTESLLDKNPRKVLPIKNLIQLKIETEAPDTEIDALYDKLYRLEPENVHNYYEHAKYYLRKGQQSEFDNVFRKAADLQYANALFNYAYQISSYPHEYYTEAMVLYKEALELNPLNDRIYVNMGACSSFLFKDEDAFGYYQKALELNPESDIAEENIGNHYRREGDQQQAIKHYQRALEINPDNYKVYNNMGISYYMLGDYENAEIAYEKAMELNSEAEEVAALDTLTYYNAALCAMELTKYEDAVDYAEAAIEAYNEHPDAHKEAREFMIYYTHGRALYFLKMYEKALESFEKAYALQPKYTDTVIFLGIVLDELGQHEEAHIYHLQAQGMDDNNFVVYEWLGWNAYLREDLSSAIRYTKKSIKLNASNGDAYYNLGRIYQKQGKDAMALKELKKAAKLGNKDAEELLKKRGGQ